MCLDDSFVGESLLGDDMGQYKDEMNRRSSTRALRRPKVVHTLLQKLCQEILKLEACRSSRYACLELLCRYTSRQCCIC